ncbi:MAG: hypothetical protein HY063_12640 [Bacteroidetes bacterium]|nr:hypothetical protein [Bacteroidota bacterium]
MKKTQFQVTQIRDEFGYKHILLLAITPALPVVTEKRAVAVLHLRKLKTLSGYRNKMELIRTSMRDKPGVFIPANLPVAVADTGTFDNTIKAYDVAANTALSKARGTAAARTVAKKPMTNQMHLLQGYVQGLADDLNNTEKAVALIESSGFDVELRTPHSKDDFTATNTKVKGTVKLAVNVKKVMHGEKRFSVQWQLTLDKITFTDLPVTTKGTTKVPGLTHATTYFFRFQVTLKDGAHGWSQWLELLVD